MCFAVSGRTDILFSEEILLRMLLSSSAGRQDFDKLAITRHMVYSLSHVYAITKERLLSKIKYIYS
jgi:hypothetical protein